MSFNYLSNCLKPVREKVSKTISCSKKYAFPKHPSEFKSGITLKSRNQYGWISRGWRTYATKTSTSTSVPEPSKEQLRLVVLQATIPFIGFGFMDNALLIIAGDAIDSTICLAFGFSTMCAAAIGNIISDLAGVGLGTVIEDYAAKLNLPVAKLSHMQRQLRSVRFHTQFGNALGLTIGCIIGMCPLLWIDSTEIERRKRLEAIDSLCRDVVVEAKGLLECESTCLYLLVEEEIAEEKPWNMSKDEQAPYLSKSKQEILSGLHDMHRSTEHRRIKKEFRAKYADSSLYNTKEPIVIPFGSGIQSIAAVRRKPVVVRQGDFNMNKIYSDGLKSPESLRDIMCVPVFSKDHKVIAILEGINKIGQDSFTQSDVHVLQSLAAHVSVSIQSLTADDENDARVKLKDMIKILKANARRDQD